MRDPVVARVHYYDRQFLRTQDFVDEQAYHLTLHRRHNIAQHIWGIVDGLQVIQDKDKNIVVQPGLAVDGYGRELVLRAGYTVSPRAFDDQASDVLDIWLVYARNAGESAERSCESKAANGQPGFYRWQESGVVEVRRPDRLLAPDPAQALTPRRRPPGVPEEDLAFDPTRTPPDEPERRWPVYLAQVRRARNQPPTYSISMIGRPYVGLVGEAIVHPAAKAEVRTRVELGSEQMRDPSRFQVSLYSPEVDRLEGRLRLDRNGNWAIRGDTQVTGDVIVDGGAIEFGAGPAYAQAMPWRLYRVSAPDCAPADESDQGQEAIPAPSSGKNGTEPPVMNELRIEMAPPEAGVATGQVVIGKWSEQEKQFVPCLTIDNQCTVTVHGNLVVEGTVAGEVKRRGTVPGSLSPGANAFAMASLFSGATGVLTRSSVPVVGVEVPDVEIPSAALTAADASARISQLLNRLKAAGQDVAPVLADVLQGQEPATREAVAASVQATQQARPKEPPKPRPRRTPARKSPTSTSEEAAKPPPEESEPGP